MIKLKFNILKDFLMLKSKQRRRQGKVRAIRNYIKEFEDLFTKDDDDFTPFMFGSVA